MEIAIPIKTLTLLRLYYNDKVWEEGMPEFDDVDHKTRGFLLDSVCFALFQSSHRAEDLYFEMLAKNN